MGKHLFEIEDLASNTVHTYWRAPLLNKFKVFLIQIVELLDGGIFYTHPLNTIKHHAQINTRSRHKWYEMLWKK